ncbi:hypothetical protein LPY66_17850 [Dehalobacter sp. DCM]|uniref:hypothetical protein n=1 Tax=Dehalobacter sp. DCM TaxID=2907827 RepID=UPI0030817355|nr:hypothetical protein LPY66_17850 [Dehalobacter sp. DCM]
MGCWVCNPLCGRCRKELKAPKKCPTCGAYNIRGYYVDNKCNQCGNDMGIGYHRPVRCLYTGLICGRACSRSKVRLPHGEVKACSNRIFVKNTIVDDQ